MIKIIFTGTSCPKNHLSNVEIEHIPFIKVEPEKLNLEDKKMLHDASFKTWIFTSKNGVKQLLNNIEDVSVLKDKVIYALGEKTAVLLKEKADDVVIPQDFNMKSLAKTLISNKIDGEVLVFSGRLRKPDLINVLKRNEVEFKEIFLYKTILMPHKVKMADFDGVVFFSPSGAQSFFQNNRLKANHAVFCIGSTTENEVRRFFSGNIFKPERSNMKSIMREIEEFVKSRNLNHD